MLVTDANTALMTHIPEDKVQGLRRQCSGTDTALGLSVLAAWGRGPAWRPGPAWLLQEQHAPGTAEWSRSWLRPHRGVTLYPSAHIQTH